MGWYITSNFYNRSLGNAAGRWPDHDIRIMQKMLRRRSYPVVKIPVGPIDIDVPVGEGNDALGRTLVEGSRLAVSVQVGKDEFATDIRRGKTTGNFQHGNN